MTDYADIYFVDGRNAVIDHRTGQAVAPGRVVVTPQMGGSPVRAVVSPAASPYGASPYGASPYGAAAMPMYYGPQGPGFWGPQGPGFYGPPGWQSSMMGSSLLNRPIGQLLDMIAQVAVALWPPPAPPNVTNDPSTDTGNLILYQSALTSYEKRDEQIRTLGHLVSKLVG